MKDSFLLKTKYKEHFKRMGEKRVYALIIAIFEYEETRIVPEMDEGIEDAFYFIKDDLDAAYENYLLTCERNAKNGSKGGRPKNPPKPKKPSGFSETHPNPPKPKKADSDYDNDLYNNNRARVYIDFYEANIMSTITPSIVDEAETFINEGITDEVIALALKEAVDNGVKKWSYARSILQRWIEKGIKTLAEAKAAQVEYRNNKPKARGHPLAEKKAFAQHEYTAGDLKRQKMEALQRAEAMGD